MRTVLRELLRQAAVVLRANGRWWLLVLLVAGAGVALLLPTEAGWEQRLIVADKHFANTVSFWGDFPRGWLMLIVLVGMLGWLLRKRNWQAVALAALLAGSAGGFQAHLLSSLIGRPRPSTGMADGLRGPTWSRSYKSFPSAHSTCAFAVATTLAVAMPAVGVPCLPLAALVGWSRVALTSHHLSDVWFGMWLGILNGLILGCAARRITDDTTPATVPNWRGPC